MLAPKPSRVPIRVGMAAWAQGVIATAPDQGVSRARGVKGPWDPSELDTAIEAVVQGEPYSVVEERTGIPGPRRQILAFGREPAVTTSSPKDQRLGQGHFLLPAKATAVPVGASCPTPRSPDQLK